MQKKTIRRLSFALGASAVVLMLALFFVPDYRGLDSPEHMLSVFVTGELVRLAEAQAAHHEAHGRYSSSLDSLRDWGRNENIGLRIDFADSTTWYGAGTYTPLSIHCELHVGSGGGPPPTFQQVARDCVRR